MLREVPFGTMVEGKRAGAFVAVTAWCNIYADYNDPTMPKAMKDALHPVVLMQSRWDGRRGFVGGLVDGDKSLDGQARDEMWEEIGVAHHVVSALSPLIAHEGERMTVHLYRVDLGIVGKWKLREWIAQSSAAPHAIAEGCSVWEHLSDYGRGKGWRALRDANNLSLAVAEELDAVRAAMYADAPNGAWPVDGLA